MVMNLFQRHRSARERELGDRLPPGQYLTDKWPVLQYGDVPEPSLATWDLAVVGLVERSLRIGYREFQQLPRKTVHADVHCVTRWSMLDSDWQGVAIQDVVGPARINPEVTHVLVHAEHGYTTNLSLEDFLRPENMLVDTRNGVPISAEHGWPLRLFVPHLYFWKSAKWVRSFEFLSHDQPGFWSSMATTTTATHGKRSGMASPWLILLPRPGLGWWMLGFPPGWLGWCGRCYRYAGDDWHATRPGLPRSSLVRTPSSPGLEPTSDRPDARAGS